MKETQCQYEDRERTAAKKSDTTYTKRCQDLDRTIAISSFQVDVLLYLVASMVLYAGKEECVECERNRTAPADFLVKYCSTVRADTPLEIREVLAGEHNRIQHGCSPHSLKQCVVCLQRELHCHHDAPLGDMIKSMMTKTAYTAQDGTFNAIHERWFPLAKLLRQGGDAVVEAIGKVQGKKTKLKFEDFVFVQGLLPPELNKVVALITSTGFNVAAMRKLCKQMKADRFYQWHLVKPGNEQVHDSRSMWSLVAPCRVTCTALSGG